MKAGTLKNQGLIDNNFFLFKIQKNPLDLRGNHFDTAPKGNSFKKKISFKKSTWNKRIYPSKIIFNVTITLTKLKLIFFFK